MIIYQAFTSQNVILYKKTDVLGGHFVLIGSYKNPIDGWDVNLYWKKNKGGWKVYYLDHESSFWRGIQMDSDGANITIRREGEVVGLFNVDNENLFYPQNGGIAKEPLGILNDNDFKRLFCVHNKCFP